MSIIEKAIGKLQAGRTREGAAEARQVRTPLRDHGPHASAIHLTPDQPDSGVRRAPKRSIALDAELLRAMGLAPPHEMAGALGEQFRRVKWPLLDTASTGAAEPGPANLIMVTSAVANEGKTFTSFNLAVSIAREKDFSVLLVDADVARARLTEALRCHDLPGLTTLLTDSAMDPSDALVGTDLHGLTFLPAGKHSSGVPELFASQRMIDLVRQLGADDPTRIVIFDSSPLLVTNEPQVLARIVDQIVLVVRAQSTAQASVLEAVELLGKTKTIRCILNQAPASRLSDYYYAGGKSEEQQHESTKV